MSIYIEGERKHKIVYPYTCPFFRSDNPVTKGFRFDDCENYITYDEFDILRFYNPANLLVKPHCSLGRKICGIMLDLSVEGVPTSTDELLKNFDDVSEYEMETIRANVDQFFRTLEVVKND